MGLVAWYKLDGNANDSSGNGLNGTASNVSWVNGKIGQAGSFNNSSINLGRDSRLNLVNSGSISIWIKPDIAFPSTSTSNSFRSIIGKVSSGGTGQQSYFIDWYGSNSSNILRFGLGDSSGLTAATTSFNPNQDWAHICATWNGTTMKLFVNGSLSSSVNQNRIMQVLNVDLRIGAFFTNWSGLIDDVKIFDHALSPKEIKLLSQAKVLHYKFDDPYEEPTENIKNSDHPLHNQTHRWWNRSGTTTTRENINDFHVRVFGVQTNDVSNAQYYYPTLITGSNNPGAFYTFSAKLKVNFANSGRGSIGFRNFGSMSYTNFVNLIFGKEYYFEYTQFIPEGDNVIPDIRAAYDLSRNGTGEVDVEWFDMQVEKKPSATPFTPTIRQGFALDSSGYQNNSNEITLATSPVWTTGEVSYGAIEFDNNYISIPRDGVPLDWEENWTYINWIKPSSVTSRNCFVSLRGGNEGSGIDFYAYVGRTNGKIGCYNGSHKDGFGNVSVNNWTHIAISFDGSNLNFYQNGSLVGNTSATLGFQNYSSNNPAIGGDLRPSITYPFIGEIDDVRIYNTDLSAEEINNIYQSRASIDNKGNVFTDALSLPHDFDFSGDSPSGGSHSNDYGLRFTVNEKVYIDSCVIRPYSSGEMEVLLHNFTTKELLQSATVNLVSGFPQEVKLGFTAKPGIEYWMGRSPLLGLMRTDSKTMGYTIGPFTFPNGSTLSGATADRYYYFFDLRYSVIDFENGFNKQGIANFIDIDEVSGTSNGQAAQITKNGTLIINGEFREVD